MPKLRIGIIGVGGRGIGFANSFVNTHAKTTEVVALADTNPVRAKAGMERLGIEPAYHEDAESLCKRSDVDAVVITTPDCFHEEHALCALSHEKHIFIDKPLATTVDGCVRIIEKAKAVKRLLYMGFNLRHHTVVQGLKRLVEENQLGSVFSLQAIEHYGGGRTYHSRWNRLKKYTGGLWLHKGSHDFDVINHLMGGVRPARVSSFASVFTLKPEGLPFEKREGVEPGPTCNACPYSNVCKDAFLIDEESGLGKMFSEEAARVDGYHRNLCMYLSDKDTYDQGVATIEYENGATATHTECFVTPLSNRRYWVDGTNGHAEADLHASRIQVFPRWTKNVVTHELRNPSGGHGGADPVMIQDFIECLQTGKAPMANAVDGVWSVAIGCAAEISREEHRVVELSDLMDTNSKLLRKQAP